MPKVVLMGSLLRLVEDSYALHRILYASDLSKQEADWASDAILLLRVPGVPGREIKDLVSKFRKLLESDSVDMTPRGSMEAWREYLLSLIVQ